MLIACSAVPVLAGAVVLHTAQVHWWHYASLALCVLCGAAAIATGREALLPVALLAVLAVEAWCCARARSTSRRPS